VSVLEAFAERPPESAADLLGRLFPPLATYCPILSSVSAPQAAFLLAEAAEVLYGGAAGGGKTAGLLMAALQYVDVPGYAALLLRRTYDELEQEGSLIPLSKEWLLDAPRSARPRWHETRHLWTFPSGATIRFGHCQYEQDKYRYQSGGYQLVGFDELTHFSEGIYLYIGFSRRRRRIDLADIGVPTRVRSAANPGGVGHGWVKRRLVDVETREPASVFIPAKVSDNPGLDADEYAQTLGHLDEVLRRQLLDGDWGVAEGLAFTYRDDLHSVPAFPIPNEWDRFEGFDHGTTNPACLLALAVDKDQNYVVFDSYYSPGLPSKHAQAFREKRQWWWPKDDDGWPIASPVCWADPEMWAVKGETRLGDPASDITEYHDLGIEGFVKANNRRRAGRMRIAELLTPDPERFFPRWHPRYGEKGAPQLYVVASRCPELVEQLKVAPLLPIDAGHKDAGEIVDPGWESRHGHAVAALRYACMSRTPATEEPEAPPEDERRRAVWEIEQAELRESEEMELAEQMAGLYR